jgi:carbonic anhydrase/acetyltransferase-like protein (isoleucine patch superfamily)
MSRYTHLGRSPQVNLSAWLAPTATLCGDVRIGPDCAIAHGAVLDAGNGVLTLGRECVVMENAVLKASRHAPLAIGNNVLVGPRAYLTGCTIEDEAFLATGSTVFNEAVVGRRAEVRINGVVHIRTRLAPDATVPIGWVAVGDPAEILPPGDHARIWAIQEKLDFPKVVFGLDRPPPGGTIMPELTRRYAAALRRHAADDLLSDAT